MTTLKKAYIKICYEDLDNLKRDMLDNCKKKKLVKSYKEMIEQLENEINEIIIDKE